ncbi:hypothetical protein GLOIN_2v1786410 [Rhizophagus irregularis DAOM 181602=DAOM 197198]|nr:hypothetical protein GLOIN_2v1786410 [Rhizophagus irregularis DAOM 181602=DAOM 197198]
MLLKFDLNIDFNIIYFTLKNLATKIDENIIPDNQDFPEKLLTCIFDNNWWNCIKKIVTLLVPYCAMLNNLQRKMGFVLLLCMVPTVLLSELEDYRSKKYTYTESISKQFKNNILDYWNFIKGYSKELYKVVQRIFSITNVSTASLERLFSTMG